MAKKAKAHEFDRDAWEYLTYAPGYECSACQRTIRSLEPVRRKTVDHPSEAPLTVYRHNQCPATPVVAV
ncbi:hypothetical protein WEB32_10665 [Streptomyces netropsis]|uniref:Uncharacterized protein n=1 Tax=Streptomyces netropsis TaxID=55404 RepID=A0A7W7L6X7_STRNE|nr:hypothetical protein [Streptomyces netropsis]MBB4884497.1 hypothetical protein [Streptomyces netropsis]